jgi:heme/copper-type cytochrome/quinol oxidase subunit 1
MLNMISSMGVFVLGASVLPFLRTVFRSLRYGEPVDLDDPDDPWGYGKLTGVGDQLPATAAPSPNCPVSDPSARPSSCTSRRWPRRRRTEPAVSLLPWPTAARTHETQLVTPLVPE